MGRGRGWECGGALWGGGVGVELVWRGGVGSEGQGWEGGGGVNLSVSAFLA